MKDNTSVLSELVVPGVIPELGDELKLNTNEAIQKLSVEYSTLKEFIGSQNNFQQGVHVLQGIEVEIIAFDENDPTRSSINSFNEYLSGIEQPLGGINADPETWPAALELNSRYPAPVLCIEEWFISFAHGLSYLLRDGFRVALPSAQSTTDPEHLRIDFLSKGKRTQELARAMPGEVVGLSSGRYCSKNGTILHISPSEISVRAGNSEMRLSTAKSDSAVQVLSSVTKSTLGSLQFHLSGECRNGPHSNSGSHAVCHNSALWTTFFGLALGGSAPIFAGVNTLNSDFRLPLYNATVGSRRAPLGCAWFDDTNILKIFDLVMGSPNPLLISLDSSKPSSGTSLVQSALKTIWPPLVRPTVTQSADGTVTVHPEIRAIGTPQTLHDAVAMCYFLAGIWKRLPDYLEYTYGIDFSAYLDLEAKYPYQKFLDSVWEVTIMGLKGEVLWFDGLYHIVGDLILSIILPLADEGLVELGIPEYTRSLYLGGIQRNLELKVTSGSIELLPLQFGVTDPGRVREVLKQIHSKVTQRSLDSFLKSRYSEPFFVADALGDLEFMDWVRSLCV